jgi:hydrogenase nickel incorporation protein HypB
MVLNKTDLLPHLDFDVQRCIDYARRVNPASRCCCCRRSTGEGMDAWLDWLLHPRPAGSVMNARRRHAPPRRPRACWPAARS